MVMLNESKKLNSYWHYFLLLLLPLAISSPYILAQYIMFDVGFGSYGGLLSYIFGGIILTFVFIKINASFSERLRKHFKLPELKELFMAIQMYIILVSANFTLLFFLYTLFSN